jgi:hypothetical protein
MTMVHKLLTHRHACRCPPGVCTQQGNATCVAGHQGPLCSLCIPGFALQSGKCRECVSLGAWPQVIAAALALVIFIFLFFFSWFPLLPSWVQQKLSFSSTKINNFTGEQASKNQGEREEFGKKELQAGSESETSGIQCCSMCITVLQYVHHSVAVCVSQCCSMCITVLQYVYHSVAVCESQCCSM